MLSPNQRRWWGAIAVRVHAWRPLGRIRRCTRIRRFTDLVSTASQRAGPAALETSLDRTGPPGKEQPLLSRLPNPSSATPGKSQKEQTGREEGHSRRAAERRNIRRLLARTNAGMGLFDPDGDLRRESASSVGEEPGQLSGRNALGTPRPLPRRR